MNNLQIGWATVDITPDRPVYVSGQLYQRISSYVHDPLGVTVLVLENGEEQCTMVAMDTVTPVPEILKRVRERIRMRVQQIDPLKINFSSIHTHNSTRFNEDGLETLRRYFPEELLCKLPAPSNILTGEEGCEYMVEKLLYVIEAAWSTRKPGGISWAADYAAVGFNRRPVFADENGNEYAKMYGDCSQGNFRRLEGPSDHTADMLYTWDTDGKLTGVAVDIPCPSQVMELHCFLSADFWAPTRDHIRTRLGDHIHILSLCGAAGDQNPLDLIRISKVNQQELIRWNEQATEVLRNFDLAQECDEIGQRIAEAVERGYRKARNRIQYDVTLHHKVISLDLPLRQVSDSDCQEAQAILDDANRRFDATHPMSVYDQVRFFEPMGVLNRKQEQKESAFYRFQMNVIRIGRIAIVTSPFELFVDYGMRVRARSTPEQVLHVQLCNGHGGYLPTWAAIAGGSYSSKPASTKVGPDGGDVLAERMIEEINALWQ